MKYILSTYSKTSGELVAELDVSDIGAEDLARIFGQDVRTFVESYPVGQKEAGEIADATGVDIDLNEGEFFLEVFEDDG